MSNPIQVNVKTNVVNLGGDNPVQDSSLFCQSTIDETRANDKDSFFQLTSREERIMHKTVLNHCLSEVDKELQRHPSKDITIVEHASFYTIDTTDTQHDVLLTVYDGPGEPPALLSELSYKDTAASDAAASTTADSTAESCGSEMSDAPAVQVEHCSDFIRTWSSSGADAPPRRRWIKIHIVTRQDDDVQWIRTLELLNHSDVKGNDGRVLYIPIKVIRRFISSHQVDLCGFDAATNVEISKATDIELSSIKKIAGLNLGMVQYHQYNAEDTFAGAYLVHGSKQIYRTGSNDTLYQVEKPWAPLMLAGKPNTLADVVIQRHPHQLGFLQTHDGISILSNEFRGVEINVRVGKHIETRIITGFREGKVEDTPMALRHCSSFDMIPTPISAADGQESFDFSRRTTVEAPTSGHL
ncbi:hypothetical protein MBLNU13_g10416t1 [Cladosporium sp. NU13]